MEDYYRWNYYLKSIRKAIASQPSPFAASAKVYKKTIAQLIRRSQRQKPSSFHLHDCVVFYLQLLSLPCGWLGPPTLILALKKVVKTLRLLLRLWRCPLLSRPETFFDYLTVFYTQLVPEKLLFLYVNSAPREFRCFLIALKTKLLRLIFEIVTVGFPHEKVELLKLYVKRWGEFKLLKEQEELWTILRLRVPPDIEQYMRVPLIRHKFWRVEESMCSVNKRSETTNKGEASSKGTGEGKNEKENENEKEKERSVPVEYSGTKHKEYEASIKKLANKKEAQIVVHLETFNELLCRLSSEKRRRAYFVSEKEYLFFRKSYSFAILEYFLQRLELLHQSSQLFLLWNVIRLTVGYLTDFNKSQLAEVLKLSLAKLVQHKSCYNLTGLQECFALAFDGVAVLSEAEQEVDVQALEPKCGDGQYMNHSIEEFCRMLDKLISHGKDVNAILHELDQIIFDIKVINHSRAAALFVWSQARLRTPDYTLDSWQKHRASLHAFHILGYLSCDEYEEAKKPLFQKLNEFSRVKFVAKSAFLLQGRSERLLDPSSSLATIDEFTETYTPIVKKSFDCINALAKEIYEQQRPGNERYEQLNKTVRRLYDALKKGREFEGVEFELKVYGSAANSFWTVKSDIDISLVVARHLTAPPMLYLEKASNAIRRANIGTLELIRSVRVPIIKFKDVLTDISCDINYNNLLGLANSALIAAYAHYDQRFHILGFLLKEWAKANGLQGGEKQFLTSYAYLNMLILYLQTLQPPVLPPLQKLFLSECPGTEVCIRYPVPKCIVTQEAQDDRGDFYRRNDALRHLKMVLIRTNVYFEQNNGKVRDFMERQHGFNYMSVSQLFAGFFRFYAFDFDTLQHKISIKEGRCLPKDPDAYVFTIDDPFDLYHNPGKTLQRGSPQAKLTLSQFRQVYLCALQGFHLTLDNP